MDPRQSAPPGLIVYGADGEPFGTITSSEEDYLVVDTGGIPPTYYVPVGAIFDWEDDGLYLSVTSAEAQRQGWEETPAAESISEAGARFEHVTGYSVVQAEDSLADDPMPTPGDGNGSATADRLTAAADDLLRQSGKTGLETAG